MPEFVHVFQSGRMNKDLDERLVPNGEYRDALNLDLANSDNGNAGSLKNVPGNSQLRGKPQWNNNYIDSLTNAKCIGSFTDDKSDKIYWFITSDEADCIAEYTFKNAKIEPVIVDTNNVLNFSSQYLITAINIIDNLLFWTDNNSEPKTINIDKFKRGSVNFVTQTKIPSYDSASQTYSANLNGRPDFIEADVTVIKKSPLTALTLDMAASKYGNAPGTGASPITLQYNPITTPVNERINFTYAPDDTLPNLRESLPTRYDWEVNVANDPNYYDNTSIDGWDGYVYLNFTTEVNSWNVGDTIILKATYENEFFTEFEYGLSLKINSISNTSSELQFKCEIQAISSDIGTFINDTGAIILFNWEALLEEDDAMFEEVFPRFAYRWKFIDNEYSTFSPFSEIAFLPGNFSYESSEGYNIAMENNVRKLILKDINWGHVDVESIDILYKESNSSAVYKVDTLVRDESYDSSGNLITEFEIKTELIGALIESNQILRPWDNVPRKAQAQEIIGNRIVYANYLQNYNVPTTQLNLSSESIEYGNLENTVGNPTLSVKSIRTYQGGIVYIDKYGRETPVFTNKDASTKINIGGSSTFNRLQVSPTNTPPDWATHYKVFIKETSNEYYNLALDRYYDAEDGNVWLSFPSSERNKVSEGTYLITKKKHDSNDSIDQLNRYKILSISNEAPDFIRTVQSSIGAADVENRQAISPGALGFGFVGPSPLVDPEFGPGMNGNKVQFSLGNFKSEIYAVEQTKVVNQPTDATTLYELTIQEPLGQDGEFLVNVPIGSSFVINVLEDKQETKPEYQGRFFVKIPRNFAFDTDIMASFTALDPEYAIKGSLRVDKGFQRVASEGPRIIVWGDYGNNFSNGSAAKCYVVGPTNWLISSQYTPGYTPNPISGPLGRNVNGSQADTDPTGPFYEFFQNFRPPTRGFRHVGLSAIRNRSGVYINAMLGNVKGQFAGNDGPNADRTGNMSVPNGYLTGGASIRFRYIGPGQYENETSIVYTVEQAQSFMSFRGGDEIDDRNDRYSILMRLNQDLQEPWFPEEGDWATSEYIEILALQPVIPGKNRLLTSNNPAIFETEPKEAVDLDLYYQASNAIPIANYNTPFQTLNWFNCYTYGNGAESNRIRDDFNAVTIDKGATVSSILADPYGEERRGSGYIFSQIYNSTSGINRLNQFIQALPITKDLNPIYGTIQKLHARDTDLITLCEDKCFRVLANKDALFNADGNANVTSNNNVLGQATPYAGEFGISKNPESFADYGFRLYFTDKNRGTVLRLSRDGLTEISTKGMGDFFADVLKFNSTLIGTYDADNGLYNLSLPTLGSEWNTKLNPIQSDNLSTACEDNVQNPPATEDYVHTTVSFKESVDGWTSRKSFMPESGVSLNDRYFTFKEGLIWVHGENPLYNNFYGEQYVSSFNVLVNDSPNIVKGYTALNYSGTKSRELEYEKNNTDEWYSIAEVNAEGWRPTSTRIKNAGWYVNYVRTNLEAGEIKEFENKEGKYFNYIKTLAVCGEAFGLGYSTETTSDPQNYLLTTFIDFNCSNTGSSTDPDEELKLWTDWDQIVGVNDITIALETVAADAKCIIEGFYNVSSDYTNIIKDGIEFKYFATAGLQVGTQLYDYNTEQPLTTAGLGLYVPPTTRVEIPNDAALDPNNTSVNPPDNYDFIIYNSSGIITEIVQYNTINVFCSESGTGPLTFEVTTTAASTNVELPYDATGTYSGIINWGDGNTSANSYANRTHTYTAAGVYTIEISGRSSKIIFGNLSNSIAALYTKLVQFGFPMTFERLSFGAISNSNHGAINMDFSEVLDIPSFAANANIDYLLSGSLNQYIYVNNFNNIEAWNVSNVTSMQSCFYVNLTFNQPLNSWNVSGVTTMFDMFAGARDFNQPLNSWNVSNVTNMGGMFRGIQGPV